MSHKATHLFVLLLSLATMVSAQILVPFNGIVTDLSGHPIKKVKVYNYDAKRFTFTDSQGRFGLTNVRITDTLHLVYKKVQYDIPVDGKRSMRIRLADQQQLVSEDEDLVDLGMLFVKRREFGGSSSGLNGEELVRMGYTNVVDAILGRVPGVTQLNGSLVIRGISSITLKNDPLYLVDGVEVSSLSNISIYDVDHIEVTKDSNIYGARGACGVISVTTKRGK